MDVPDPGRIQVDTEAQTLTIEWTDGHTSVFPLDQLRAACPCAECEGDAVDHIAPPDAQGANPTRERPNPEIEHIEPAGSVGIRITWDDGHRAGIFRWDRLRRLQPKKET